LADCTDWVPWHFLYFLPLPQGHGSFLSVAIQFTPVLLIYEML
jgi:hypothetical protein